MDTINRLQFRHHNEIFETREDAIEYIYDKIKEEGEGIASGQNSVYSYSLFAEPTILRYKNEDDEAGCEYKKGPHIMLVIGSETNDTIYHDRNKFCIIDIDKTEEEIKNLEEEIEKIIKSLTVTVFDTSTLDLHVEKNDEGTFLSGDVKTAETHVFDGVVKNNNLMTVPMDDAGGPEGLFIYVDLTYDDATETFTFIASQSDGTLKKTSVKLPNNYLVSGEYKRQDESLHLKMRSGDEVVVNCEELIAEWGVEGDASKTPIVLTREEVDYDHTDEHHHVEPWQDVLRADVRLANDRPANILKKTTDGRYLYVDGVASNILYYWNGERSNVEEQLNKLNKIRISPDNDNIIWNRADGFFASTKLDYNSNENKLIFTTSTVNGQPFVKEIHLNTVEVIESITYDPTREVLVIKYKNDKGETKTIYVPISGLIDEWEVLNDAHSVKLVKQRKVSGKDILTADVNISTADNNILEERGEGNIHALFVRGTADNIKYKDTTVEGALDALAAEDEAINEKLDEEIARATGEEQRIDAKLDKEITDRTADVDAEEERATGEEQRIDSTIGSGFTTDAHETVTYKFEQLQNQVNSEAEKLQNEIDRSTEKDEEHDSRLDEQQAEIEAISADSANSLKSISSNDSIKVDDTDHVNPVISVNLSNKSGNTINLVTQEGSEGLYSTVDIAYDSVANELTLTKSTSVEGETTSTTVKLNNGISIIERIEYDSVTEEIVIYYKTTSGEEERIRIPVSHVINEWTTGETNTVLLNKERVVSGGPDVLTANVKVCHDEHHQDNAIEVHQNGLYVHSYSGEISDLSSRIDTLSGDVASEIARAEAAEQALDAKINQEIADRIADVNEEEIRALSAETALNTLITHEKDRAMNAEDAIRTDLSAEIRVSVNEEKTRAMDAENVLRQAIVSETERAINADALLQDTIEDEITRSSGIDAVHDSKIAALEASASTLDRAVEAERTRAISAETEIRNDFTNAVHDEETRALLAENTIRTDLTNAISGETVRATLAEGALQIALNAEIERSTNKDNELVNAINAEKAARETKDEELSAKIDAATLTFDDTKTIDLNKSTDNVVTANVKIANSDNNIIIHPEGTAYDGLFASATLEYEPTGNKIRLVTSNGAQEYIQLVGATLLDSIEYDSVNKMLIIKYTDGTGSQRETTVGVTDLFNDWDVANPSSGSAIELTKELGGTGENDKLYGKVLLTNLPDNAVQIVNNGLYVSNSASTSVECVSGKTNAIYKALFGYSAPGGCGEDIEYIPDHGSCVISAATSFMDADKRLGDQICEILEMWVSGMTCTTTSTWEDDGANKKMMVDVRPSYGKNATMIPDDIYITDLTGKTIEHGVKEFTDTNVLRIVCLEDGGGVLPDIAAKQNGVYLSNAWNCGKYYQESTEADEMAEVEADGYNINYFTDETEGGETADYSNYLRC